MPKSSWLVFCLLGLVGFFFFYLGVDLVFPSLFLGDVSYALGTNPKFRGFDPLRMSQIPEMGLLDVVTLYTTYALHYYVALLSLSER